MAGEYQLAEKVITEMLQTAEADPAMSSETAARALLAGIIEHNARQRSITDLQHEIAYLLENMTEDGEFVITRGC
jgi:hypothetical protein